MTDLVQQLCSALADRPDVRVALLFGSRATGRARPDSDVDLAVVAPGVDRLALAAALSEAVGLDVDVVDLQRAGVPLIDEVLRHGLLVHEGEPGAAATWRAGAWMQQETDRPWYRRMRDAWLARLAEES